MRMFSPARPNRGRGCGGCSKPKRRKIVSGERVKAKKKSAKKAAAASAPAADRPRADFIIENVRCFAGKQRVPIRPITLLVGENSAGKTTFMGCLHMALNFLVPSRKSFSGNGIGFNTPPFSLGGFRDIARKSGGKSPLTSFAQGLPCPLRTRMVSHPWIFLSGKGIWRRLS